MNWPERAACRDDPELMHEESAAGVTAAKKVCAGCPVAQSCLTYALERDEPWGVWGGLTIVERERVAVGARVQACPGCGLPHVPADAGHDACQACSPGRAVAQPPGAGVLTTQRELVTSLTVAGWHTGEICALVGCKPSSLLAAQRRWRVRRRAPSQRRPEVPCGTASGARRHYRAGESPCEACRVAANREYADRERAKAGAV